MLKLDQGDSGLPRALSLEIRGEHKAHAILYRQVRPNPQVVRDGQPRFRRARDLFHHEQCQEVPGDHKRQQPYRGLSGHQQVHGILLIPYNEEFSVHEPIKNAGGSLKF